MLLPLEPHVPVSRCPRSRGSFTTSRRPIRQSRTQQRDNAPPGHQPHRPAGPPLEAALRHPVQHRRNHLRTRQRPPSPPQPLPRPPKDPHPTRSDRHRHQHRTPRLTSTSPPQRSHGVPALPRLARPDLGMLVATRQMSSILKIPDRVAQDMRTGAYSARPSGSGSRSGPRDARRLAARQLVARRGELQDLQVVGVLM